MRLGRVWSGSRLRADFPRHQSRACCRRQGTLYSRATSVLGRDASDLDELRRGHHNASLVESSVFDLLVQADRASLIALNSTALALSGSLLLADRIPVLKQPIHDRVALHLMAHLPRVL